MKPFISHLFSRFHPVSAGLLFIITLLAGCAAGTDSHSADDHAESSHSEYTCSMHPQIRQPNPGKCPICAMDLIPVDHDANGSTAEWAISFSEQARRMAQIQTTPVQRRFVDKEVRLIGKIELDETRTRTLAARFPGRIDRLFVDYVGVPVREGDHLAEIFSPFLLTAQTELLNAVRFDGQGLSVRGAREKLRLLGLSDTAIQSIEQSGIASDRLQIDAPVSGVVIEKQVNEGDYVETGTLLFRVSDMHHLWLVLEAYEADLPWVRYGQKVRFEVKSLPGRTFDGSIAFIQPVVDPGMRTVKVRVNVENHQGILKPGMYAHGKVKVSLGSGNQVFIPELAGKWISPMHPEIIKDQPGQCDVCGMDLVPFQTLSGSSSEPSNTTTEPPLVIPASSVLLTGRRAVVYVEAEGQERPTYEGREVILGPRAGDFYLVESGLQEGERVVSHGAFKIDSSLQIQGKKSMMSLDSQQHSAKALSPNVPQEPYVGFYTRFDPLLTHYFALQQALANDDLATTRQQAQSMLPLISDFTLEDRGIGSAALQRIQASDTLDAARRGFEPLSNWITGWLRRYGSGQSIRIWRMSCPMVFGNHTAYWLQNHDQLLNPYHGAAMLRCGDTEEIVFDSLKQENHTHESR